MAAELLAMPPPCMDDEAAACVACCCAFSAVDTAAAMAATFSDLPLDVAQRMPPLPLLTAGLVDPTA
jgi:hypothetical protein